jgi:Tol biopolymer transport system component
MSGDGRYIGFTSLAADDSEQVFVHDVRTLETVPGSFTRRGSIPNAGASMGSISEDGRYIVYQSSASDIVSGDTNGLLDAFRADLRTQKVVRVSVDSAGRQQAAPRGSDSTSFSNFTPPSMPLPNISGDGRFVSFNSPASNLVPKDTNSAGDVFVHDTLTRRTVRASVSTSGQEGDANSVQGVLSRHGGLIAFSSLATNLAVDDDNAYADVFVRELFHE